jgi:hypothetical protein
LMHAHNPPGERFRCVHPYVHWSARADRLYAHQAPGGYSRPATAFQQTSTYHAGGAKARHNRRSSRPPTESPIPSDQGVPMREAQDVLTTPT